MNTETEESKLEESNDADIDRCECKIYAQRDNTCCKNEEN